MRLGTWTHPRCDLEHLTRELAVECGDQLRPPALIGRYLDAIGGALEDRAARAFWAMIDSVAALTVDRLDLPPFVRSRAVDKGIILRSAIDRPWRLPARRRAARRVSS